MQPSQYPKRRHMVTHIGIPQIAALIDLPQDTVIHRIIPRQNPDGLLIVLESPRYDEVDHDVEAPFMHGLRQHVATDDDGVTWVRWTVE